MARKLETLPPLILASASPRRSALLSRLPLSFTVVPSDAPEIHNEQLTVREVCMINAYRKARYVAKRYPDHLVLGADTLVCLGTRLFGKPATIGEARKMLADLQGRTHEVVTGVCLIHLRSHHIKTFAETSWVTFKDLPPQVIKEYVRRVKTFDKAGAYAIQEFGDMLVAQIDGSYNNVVGLPTEKLQHELHSWAL